MPPSESTGTIPPWFYDYVTSKAFQDAVRKVVDAKWLADNVPVTGAKAEVTGAKAEANAGAFTFFGAQAEYSVFKVEGAAIDLNKIWDDRAQAVRDDEVDERLRGLTADAVVAKDNLATLRQKHSADDQRLHTRVTALQNALDGIRQKHSTDDQRLHTRVTALQNAVGGIRRKLVADDQRLRTRLAGLGTRVGKVSQTAHSADQRSRSAGSRAQQAQSRITALQNAVGGIRRKLVADDQRLRTQLSALSSRIGKVGQTANSADQRSKSAQVRTKDALKQVSVLEREVKRGMRQLRELDDSARSTRGAVSRLRSDLDSLEKALRR